MKYEKMNLLTEPSNPEFGTRKWNVAYDQSNLNYSVGNHSFALAPTTQVTLENCNPFTNCITKMEQQ